MNDMTDVHKHLRDIVEATRPAAQRLQRDLAAFVAAAHGVAGASALPKKETA